MCKIDAEVGFEPTISSWKPGSKPGDFTNSSTLQMWD